MEAVILKEFSHGKYKVFSLLLNLPFEIFFHSSPFHFIFFFTLLLTTFLIYLLSLLFGCTSEISASALFCSMLQFLLFSLSFPPSVCHLLLSRVISYHFLSSRILPWFIHHSPIISFAPLTILPPPPFSAPLTNLYCVTSFLFILYLHVTRRIL